MLKYKYKILKIHVLWLLEWHLSVFGKIFNLTVIQVFFFNFNKTYSDIHSWIQMCICQRVISSWPKLEGARRRWDIQLSLHACAVLLFQWSSRKFKASCCCNHVVGWQCNELFSRNKHKENRICGNISVQFDSLTQSRLEKAKIGIEEHIKLAKCNMQCNAIIMQ